MEINVNIILGSHTLVENQKPFTYDAVSIGN